jgi:NAD(P)-dependent dehydrogenase (short-subunit alcohol dehydrogenase family)
LPSTMEASLIGRVHAATSASKATLLPVEFWAPSSVLDSHWRNYQSNMAAIKPGPNASISKALNGAVLSLTTGLATDLAAKKIRINTIVPGLVQTELWDKQARARSSKRKSLREAAERLPVGFVATPGAIAEGYLFCVRADYTTGTLVKLGKFWSGARGFA